MTTNNPTSTTENSGDKPIIDSKLVPVMREAVGLVHMVLYLELKGILEKKFKDDDPPRNIQRLAGAIANDIFGIYPERGEPAKFAAAHRLEIEEGIKNIASSFPDLLPYLTDALRMQTLCDYQEGTNSLPTLLRAQALDILLEERPMPMPSTFMTMARTLGTQYGLVEHMSADTLPADHATSEKKDSPS